MFIKDLNFSAEFSLYSERYYCKDFSKKHKKNWDITKKVILRMLERAHQFEKKSLVSLLHFKQEENVGIFKLQFAVAGRRESPKSAGNRAVFFLCNKTSTIKVLLVYGKEHCSKNQPELQWIREHIKQNFPEYKKLI